MWLRLFFWLLGWLDRVGLVLDLGTRLGLYSIFLVWLSKKGSLLGVEPIGQQVLVSVSTPGHDLPSSVQGNGRVLASNESLLHVAQLAPLGLLGVWDGQ